MSVSLPAPRAYDGTVREQVNALQRARIVAAMFDVCAERGAAGVTAAHVVERSGVSRRTFYEIFADREDCFLAAFEQALASVSERVLPAYDSPKTWLEQIRAGLVALLGFLDEEPLVARLLVVESFSGGPATLERRSEVLSKLTSAVERGRAEGRGSAAPAQLTGEGVVGAALTIIQSRLAELAHAPLIELTNPLMSMIVLPYLGAGAARKESERPAAKPPSGQARTAALGADPFKEAGMRLTYRTVRVLVGIGELGGRGVNPSNRAIADSAEIQDQGQVSKLLTRLQRAGMITNTSPPLSKGAPNSWALTPSGQRVTAILGSRGEGHLSESRER